MAKSENNIAPLANGPVVACSADAGFDSPTIPRIEADFLPGRLRVSAGALADYRTLARFHYLAAAPATCCRVWAARFAPFGGGAGRLVGVVVLSWPSALHAVRHRVFGLTPMRYGQRLRWVNANLRTISRVVVHPQFRSLGLAGALIRTALAGCPTRYVETSARMAQAHPMFARAGMIRATDDDPSRPAYFHFDRQLSR